MRRVLVLTCVLGLLTAAMVGVGLAHNEGDPPEHPHMLVQRPEFGFVEGTFGLLGWRKCVDLAAGQPVPLHAHHAHIHTGTAGDALGENADHVAVPGAPLTPWANCAEVEAARALGASNRRIIFRHILPNALAPVLVSVTFGIANAILIEAALSFLGFGVQPPTPSWGGMLSRAQEYFDYWWIMLFPGLAIFLAVTGYNMLGEGLRDDEGWATVGDEDGAVYLPLWPHREMAALCASEAWR